jgi:hypothetical protein
MAVYGPVHKLPYDPMYYAYATETPGNCTSTTTATDLGTSSAGVIIVAWDIIRKWNIVLQS